MAQTAKCPVHTDSCFSARGRGLSPQELQDWELLKKRQKPKGAHFFGFVGEEASAAISGHKSAISKGGRRALGEGEVSRTLVHW